MRLQPLIVASAIFAGAVFAQEIKLTSAPADNQVLQRGQDQTASISLSGTAIGKRKDGKDVNGKDIESRLTGSDGNPLPGFDWSTLAKIQKMRWEGIVQRVPIGGPYRLEVRFQGSDNTVSVANLLVGDLWVLAGQSNMEGNGDLIDVQPPVPLVHTFDLADRWGVAEEPLHTLVNAADAVHWPLNSEGVPERWSGERLDNYLMNRKKGAGLGLPFAEEMLSRTNIPIGLIPCAHGGTSMDQWNPAWKDREGDSLYGSMYRRVQAAGGRVKGVLWYQGESDATPKAAPEFLQKFEALVKSVREDFRQPDLPFYYVQIGRHIDKSNMAEWNAVQLAQLRAESEIAHSGMVAAVDLDLDDRIHVGTQDLKRLAKRLADLVCLDLFPRAGDFGQRKRGPRPVEATYAGDIVKVKFSGVNGRLMADGRIAGFSIHGGSGEWVPMIYKARVDPAEASSVLLYVQGKLPDNATVWYGAGKDPYCNVRDATDMAVPVFQMKITAAAPR